MDYEGPTAEDLDNIRALNAAFLRATNYRDSALTNGISSRPLTELQIRRLSMAPFLLFSFREQDVEFWERIMADDTQADLLRTPAADAIYAMQVAGLGFLWQLSRRNPYVARLVCGAPVSWCERIARLTLVEVLKRVSGRSDLTVPRFTDCDRVSLRLLQSGASGRRRLQRMSQQFALQAMLTRNSPANYERLPAAACALTAPARRVADRVPAGKAKV